MPVSFLPLIFPALLIGVPLLFLAKGQKAFFKAAVVSISLLLLLFLWVYVPGQVLGSVRKLNANRGRGR